VRYTGLSTLAGPVYNSYIFLITFFMCAILALLIFKIVFQILYFLNVVPHHAVGISHPDFLN
jgi:hypothetical protein